MNMENMTAADAALVREIQELYDASTVPTKEQLEEFKRDLLADPEALTPHGKFVLNMCDLALSALLRREGVSEDNPIVGHKSFRDGPGFRHEPLRKSEADALMARIDLADSQRREAMPDEQSAINTMFNGWLRLQDFGWRQAMYCPKDGTSFLSIEAGSTGIHQAHYQGEWPDGSWWVHDDGDLWPSRPIMFKPLPDAPTGSQP